MAVDGGDNGNVLRSAMRARIRSEVRAQIEKMERESIGERDGIPSPSPSSSSLLREMSNLNITQHAEPEAIDSERIELTTFNLTEIADSKQSMNLIERVCTAVRDRDLWWMAVDAVMVYLMLMWYLSVVEAQWALIVMD